MSEDVKTVRLPIPRIKRPSPLVTQEDKLVQDDELPVEETVLETQPVVVEKIDHLPERTRLEIEAGRKAQEVNMFRHEAEISVGQKAVAEAARLHAGE